MNFNYTLSYFDHLQLSILNKYILTGNSLDVSDPGNSPWILDWAWYPLFSCLHSLLGYSEGEFHVLQMIVFVVFGAVD